MALFSERPTEKLFGGGDTATRALSSTVVENAFVERVYEKLAGVYDLTFGPTLHPGRLQAIERMAIRPARACSKWASAPGSTWRSIRARARSSASTCRPACSKRRASGSSRKGLRNCRVMEMDAADDDASRTTRSTSSTRRT